MIKIADTDGSGVVEFQEFMEMICDQMEGRSSSKLVRRWLREGAYYLCVLTLSHFLNEQQANIVNIVQRIIFPPLQVSDEEIEEAFKMFDRDNSGTINHNEVK